MSETTPPKPRSAALGRRAFLGAAAVGASFPMIGRARAADPAIRVGHFPNITHVQGLIGHYLTRMGKPWFEPRLGVNVPIDWYIYNAGPSAMEAIFADTVDLTYVGPSPALNAYSKSKGRDIRIIAGAATGGAALVVQAGSGLKSPADFKGKKIATPQLGNTQDVSARSWLAAGGLRITLTGGDAQVIPTANPDQLSLFKRKELDAVWTVEPWVSRLELEAGGEVVVEETDAVTTVLVSSAKFLGAKRDLVKKFAAAHRELTDWIKANPDKAKEMLREELSVETRADIPAKLIEHTWPRIGLTTEITRESMETFVGKAKAAGFLRDAPDLGKLVERV